MLLKKDLTDGMWGSPNSAIGTHNFPPILLRPLSHQSTHRDIPLGHLRYPQQKSHTKAGRNSRSLLIQSTHASLLLNNFRTLCRHSDGRQTEAISMPMRSPARHGILQLRPPSRAKCSASRSGTLCGPSRVIFATRDGRGLEYVQTPSPRETPDCLQAMHLGLCIGELEPLARSTWV